jgi:hypothetical protein
MAFVQHDAVETAGETDGILFSGVDQGSGRLIEGFPNPHCFSCGGEVSPGEKEGGERREEKEGGLQTKVCIRTLSSYREFDL